MKFKFVGVEKISSKIRNFLKENLKGCKMLKWDQNHDLLWKLTNQDPIIFVKLFTLIILLKMRKKSNNYEGSDTSKNESFCSKDDRDSEGTKDEIYEN